MGLGSELYSTSNDTQSWQVSAGTGTNCVQHITVGSDVQKGDIHTHSAVDASTLDAEWRHHTPDHPSSSVYFTLSSRNTSFEKSVSPASATNLARFSVVSVKCTRGFPSRSFSITPLIFSASTARFFAS